MALIELAVSKKDKNITLATLAERQSLSLSYLEQLFAKLRKFGIVKSTRGIGGGYELARPEQDIKIYDIILAAEGPVKMLRCSNSKVGCQTTGKQCNSHNLWHGLEQTLIDFLSKTTLHDVVNGTVSSKQNNFKPQVYIV
jgi:Rrf2 family iron-sulfur cluster assembly transcriptional regulator